MLRLPDDMLQEHVWPRVHELRMRAALAQICAAGPSECEDLPDLLDTETGMKLG